MFSLSFLLLLLGNLTMFQHYSAGLHTNYGLMEELVSCKKVLAKALPGAPNVCCILI
jgi:hypothetical protein